MRHLRMQRKYYQGNHPAVEESRLVPNFPVTNQDSDSKGSNDIQSCPIGINWLVPK